MGLNIKTAIIGDYVKYPSYRYAHAEVMNEQGAIQVVFQYIPFVTWECPYT